MLVGAVLLQPGKTDAGALFTSNVSSNAFGPRGTATVLSKITIAAAVVFMLSALMISMPALSGNVSVLNTATETTEGLPVGEANANSDANSAAADNTNSALIQTPATEQFSNQAANTASASETNTSAPANANAAKPSPANK